MSTKNPHQPILGKLVEKKVHALRRANVMLQRGREWLSPLQLEPPIGYKKQKSLVEQIREQVRSEALRAAVRQQGLETFEEADDFDVGDDDFDPKSPYEEIFEPEIVQVPPGPEATQPQNVAPQAPTPPASPPAGGQGQGGAQPPPLAERTLDAPEAAYACVTGPRRGRVVAPSLLFSGGRRGTGGGGGATPFSARSHPQPVTLLDGHCAT